MKKLFNLSESIEQVELTSSNILEEVVKETKLPEDVVRRILIFLNFSIKKADGELTKFAEDYKIYGYEDFYNFIKKLKQDYKTDNEAEAFSVKFNDLWKSLQPRVAAWIFKTFVAKQEGEEMEKYIRANFFAGSFINRSFGQIAENLRLFKKVVKALDKYSEEFQAYINEQVYTSQEEAKDKGEE